MDDAVQDPRSGAKISADLYVTRKGATPAAPGQMGLIPGSMGAPCPCIIDPKALGTM